MDESISVLKVDTFPFIMDLDHYEIIRKGLEELRNLETLEDSE